MSTNQPDRVMVSDFDPFSEEFAADPYPVYAALRAEKSILYYPDHELFLVSRFDDIDSIVKNDRMVRSMHGVFSQEEIDAELRRINWHDMPYHSRFVQFSLLDSDGQVHDRLRRLIFRMFTPASIHRLREKVQQIVDQMLGELGAGTIDFVNDFAASIPGLVIGDLIGVPREDCAQLHSWSESIVQYFDIDRSDYRKELAETSTRDFYRYLCEIKRQRLESPGNDLVSHLIDGERSGLLNENEFISTCMLVLMAGHGSTLDVLGTGLYNLLQYPEQMDRLRRERLLMSTAIQEMFRFESPLPFFHRYAADDVVINGEHFPAGTKFGLLYGSANRDPDHFENPDTFDVGRTPNRHLAFGGGAHFCLGNHIARLNMDVIFSTLLRDFSNIELVENKPEFKRGLSIRGLNSLHVALTPR